MKEEEFKPIAKRLLEHFIFDVFEIKPSQGVYGLGHLQTINFKEFSGTVAVPMGENKK